jgi:hypothetical protein
MISQPYQITRINKMGKPYVQSSDPSLEHEMATNDMWLNPTAGTIKMWDGTGWMNMQWGASAIMDDCIANRVIADNISANKITTGVLQSQNGDFALDLTTGEARLLKLIMGGEVEGNIIATSSNGLTRVRLRGREDDRDITAGIIFEQREDVEGEPEWENAGQIYFGYSNHQTYAAIQNYMIGKYNSNRPLQAYNSGTDNGLMFRPVSLDWLKANYVTYRGTRFMTRDKLEDGTYTSWTGNAQAPTAVGNITDGTSIVTSGIATCTYAVNLVMRIDFNIKVTTAGSGSASFGISRDKLRQLNADIPVITTMSGGNLQIFNASGALVASHVGGSFIADGSYWHPAHVSGSSLAKINESAMAVNYTLVGTCYGRYTL